MDPVLITGIAFGVCGVVAISGVVGLILIWVVSQTADPDEDE